MKRHSVVRKLFFITSLIIIGLLTIVLMLESLFFERFYKSVKQHEQETAIVKLIDEVEALQSNEQEIAYTIGRAMNEYDASIALLNEDLSVRPLDVYFIHLQSGTQIIKVMINEEGMRYGELPSGISQGQTLVVDGIFMDQHDTVLHPIDFNPEASQPEPGLVRVSGTISRLLLPEQRSYNPLYQDLLITDMIQDWNTSEPAATTNPKPYVTTEWIDSWSGVTYIATLGKLEASNTSIVMMESLQPVNEAIAMLRKYVMVLFPFIVVIVIILAVMYSRYIARPLVKINSFAAKLAQLQFSGTPPVQSRDEYGELSSHLVTLSDNLERALEEVKLRNEQLQVEIDHKIQQEELRKELVANIAHELKTPLSVVKGYAEGLQDGIAAHKQDVYLAHIVRETDVMNELIMDLLELSKYEGNAIKLKLANINLVELLQAEVQALAIHLANKALKANIETSMLTEPYVVGDYKRLKQVIVNLLSNAARHANSGSTITITVKPIDAGRVKVTIYNEGQPISKSNLQRIWDKFYRVEQARDRRSGGTGLGLTIVKHILLLHHSEFGAVNQLDGVAFYFTLKEGRVEDDDKN